MEKIEKLELKHLCGYLPYGLKYLCNDIVWDLKALYVSTSNRNYKPLLLPLSALMEPMDDGSVPIDIIQKFNIGHVVFITLEREHFINLYGRERWIGAIPNMIIEYLYSRHFDIYGLIPAGLAIDKRTLIKTQ